MRVWFICVTFVILAAFPSYAAADFCCDECCCVEHTAGQNTLATVIFHLPLAFNDGAPVPESLLEEMLTAVTEFAGGFTYHEATGGWLHEGNLYREPVWVVKVGVEPGQVDDFEELVTTRLKTDFKQLAVWFEETGEAEIR